MKMRDKNFLVRGEFFSLGPTPKAAGIENVTGKRGKKLFN